ncbi:hypothetical protein [Ulvibacterium sp.]|uniref:hypothetical protein n=1 Tax=Ulvibacterium sp. TaxID=2665914 RepID=UPI0026115E4C|nr:hypothetical protein [Ulvibacterium sp.]
MKIKAVIEKGTMFLLTLILIASSELMAQQSKLPTQQELEKMGIEEWKNQIRREKFDIILPKIMKKRKVDMWIHVMRDAVEDPFGEKDLGSASGVFVFTDRGSDRIERAIIGRRWGGSQRGWRSHLDSSLENSKAFDIIGEPVFVVEPIAQPLTEYDFRFKGLKEFVEERDPKVIALNFMDKIASWPTSQEIYDGISHTDYRLLTKELGEKYSDRIISSEYLMMDYQISPVPSEVKMLKKMRQDELVEVEKIFKDIIPGKTKVKNYGQIGDSDNDEAYVVPFRRMSTGLSQRARSEGWENAVVEGGDIIAATTQAIFGYVLREGETEAPQEIKKLWEAYKKIDQIFAETIRVGRTPREIVKDYTERFKKINVEVEDDQMHMIQPKNNYPEYAKKYGPEKIIISVDCHGKGMGATAEKHDIYLGPRIGSYGPDWVLDVPLQENHHFVLEYFFYMPSPGPKDKDQYLFFWDHEQAFVTKDGVEYLAPQQDELILIK